MAARGLSLVADSRGYSLVAVCWLLLLGFPGGSDGKESTCNAGDLGSIPGLGRSLGGRERLPTPVFWPGESPWTGFSCCRAQALKLSGSVDVAHRLGCPVVCGIFLYPGWNLCPPALQGRFLTTGPPGKPQHGAFKISRLPWSGKIPRATGQLSLCTTTTKAHAPYSLCSTIREATAMSSLCSSQAPHNQRKCWHSTEDPAQPKIQIMK